MKFIIVTIVLIATCSGGDHSEEHKKFEQECMIISGHSASHEKLHQLLLMRTLAPSQPEKCFVKCFAEKTFVVDATGKVNGTTLKAPKIPYFYEKAKMTDAIISECGAKNGTTPCDVGYAVGRCLIEKAGHKSY